MKTKYIFLILFFLIFSIEISAQPCSLNVQPIKMKPPGYGLGYDDFELAIYNQTRWFGTENWDTIMVIMTPVGLYFDGAYKYNPNSAYTIGDPQQYTTVSGEIIKIPPQSNSELPSRVGGNWDKTQGSSSATFAFGIGKYKFEFYRRVEDNITGLFHWEYSNYVYVDYSDVRLGNLPPVYGSVYDIRLDYFSKDTITYQYNARALSYPDYDSTFWLIDLVNKDIKMWELFGTCLNPIARERGNLLSDSSNYKAYLNWPILASQYNGNLGEEDPGYLKMNLEIQNNHYARINRGIPFSVNDSAKLSLKHSDTYADNARLYVVNNSLFSVKPAATLEINKYGNVIIESGGVINLEENSNLVFRDHGEIIVDSGGTLNNCGAIISDTTFVCIIVHPQGHFNVGPQFCTHSATHNFTKGAFLVLNGGDLTIGDSSKIVFDGASSFLRINPQSKIFLGENASIEFKNGAYISANGCTFNSIDSLKKWKGIVLENSGIDSITNCTFSNAKTAITVKNTTGSFENRVIKNNTFNIPAGGDHKGIYGENNYNILIQDNTFNMPVNSQLDNNFYFGIYLKNSSNNGEPESAGQTEEETMPFPFSLNIINNNFKNGSGSIILANYLSNVLPYYIKGNSFDSASSLGILGLKITGTIKDNVSADFVTPLGIHLVNSSPNLYNNTTISRDVSLHLIGNSYPNLSTYI